MTSKEYNAIGTTIAELKRKKRQADIEFVDYCRETKCRNCPMYKEIECGTAVYLEYKERGLLDDTI